MNLKSKLGKIENLLMENVRLAYLATKLYLFCSSKVFGFSTREIAFFAFNRADFRSSFIRLIEEAIDHFNSVSYLTSDITIWKAEYTSYIDGVGSMFLSDQDRLAVQRLDQAIMGADNPDVQSNVTFDF